ncbi:NUDIX domain-containing protein [Sphingobacterium sp. SYP-B4668]|uniref:NUDIX domain-containing protein n=1 Tax=Sphingobacterium sp. SYP-B4668 TaxID=2996035 RepID=UPI0022DE3B3C|nr:NUDIX hydrolase [Sphingobacterium sp. SYP-B4668]
MYPFNVRVYGILINEDGQVLISDEKTERVSFTKFPGGGLEYGEGLIDALKREYLEECDLHVEVIKHIYTTDFWEKSSFNESQIISIYYLVRAISPLNVIIKQQVFDFEDSVIDDQDQKLQSFRLVNVDKLQANELTFKTDQVAWQEFIKQVTV